MQNIMGNLIDIIGVKVALQKYLYLSELGWVRNEIYQIYKVQYMTKEIIGLEAYLDLSELGRVRYDRPDECQVVLQFLQVQLGLFAHKPP